MIRSASPAVAATLPAAAGLSSTTRLLVACVVGVACLFSAACGGPEVGTSPPPDAGPVAVPPVVTADIKSGIERHVEEQVRSGGGRFDLAHRDRTLRLRLVRVHTEYLSNLGPRSHFACVDLVDESGDVYDVDFFLAGDPGAMTVTETSVHKINGQPYYAWNREPDGTWRRIPVERADETHFGVLRGSDAFEFLYRAKLPDLAAPARMWLPFPETDAFQTVEVESIEAPGRRQVLRDREHGNRVLLLELLPEDGGRTVEIRFGVRRREKAAWEEPSDDPARFLAPERLVPGGEDFRTLAQAAVGDAKSDLVRARALYDHVIDRMRYMKYGTGWGQGDAAYACDARTGNCTDFHAYFIALARSVGIPARFAIGAAIPSERDDGGIDGYHCWAEFHADGRWWPVDISEGDKYSALATYYFGHHPANRFQMSRGRDLVVDPLPASGPINFLAYPLLEVDGRPAKAEVTFSFVRRGSH